MHVIISILVLLFTSCAGFTSSNNTAGLPEPSAQSYAKSMTILAYADSDPYTASLAENRLPDKVELFYFYEQDCGICNELDVFYDILLEKLPADILGIYPSVIYIINTLSMDGRQIYNRITEAMGLDRMLLLPPLLIAGGKIFQGNETIANNIQEAFLTAGEDIFVNQYFYNPALRKTGEKLFEDFDFNPDHVTAVYFYRIACPDCREIIHFIDDLPETFNVDGRQVPFDLIKINTRSGNNNDRIMAFFDKYKVPDADRHVPIIFLANSYLSGVQRIKNELSNELANLTDKNLLAEILY